MNAYVFTKYSGPESQRFVTLPDPMPGPGQVQIRVRAAGVNPADWKVRSGLRRDAVPITFPAVLGREVAGVVSAVGSPDTGFAVGDAIFGASAQGCGGYRRCTVLDGSSAALIPESVSFADAATLPVAAGTAFDALDQLDLAPGSTLVVVGAGGGVGVAAVQLAAARGVRVLAVSSVAKREQVRGLGAHWIDSGPNLADRLNFSVDAALDLVGGYYLPELTGLVAGNRIVSTADVPAAQALGGAGVIRRRTRNAFNALAALVADGTVDPLVRARYQFADAERALAAVEAGHVGGKVVIDME